MFDSFRKIFIATGERVARRAALVFIKVGLLVTLAVFAVPAAYGQDARLQLKDLDKLAEKADESLDINLEGVTLSLAEKALSSERSPEEAMIKELVKGLKGIFVKRFEFEKEGEYTNADIEPLRAQLRSPGWSRIVGVKNKRGGENIEVYAMAEGEKMIGLAVIALEARELTVVNIVGMIDLEKLIEVAKYFGMPGLELEKPVKPGKE